jgi:hypothetical protein
MASAPNTINAQQHFLRSLHLARRGVYRKFSEGFGTADLLAARDLLGQLA